MRFASAWACLLVLLGVTQVFTQVTIADYICQRLVEVGTDTVFSVTGDYSYLFLHAVEENPGLKRVGNNNELEASYAAWAYAHSSPVRAPGVVSVTYGPGSYPTISALGGAARENVPVIVIAGAGSTTNWQYFDSWGAEAHHMLEGPTTQRDAFVPVTVAQEIVSNTATAAQQIDNLILAALIHNKPVYLEVWLDLWTATIPAPAAPLSRAGLPTPVATVQSNVNAAVAYTLAQLQASHFPIIFVSLEIKIYAVQDLFEELISLANIPYYTNYAAKGLLAEPNPWYTGILGTSNVPEYQADFLLEVGTTYDDNSHTTASFAPNAKSFVRARRGKVDSSNRNLYNNVPLEPFLVGLIAAIQSSGYYNHNYSSAQYAKTFPAPTQDDPSSNVTYASFVNHLQYDGFVNNDTILVVDTTIIMYYIQKVVPIRQDGYIGDAFWLAIGWSGGAVLGVKQALPDKRALVIVGDGGFQNCPTGLGTSVALGHDTIVFILHNNVYAIEQHEEDPTPYTNNSAPFFPDNLIQNWNYAQYGAAVGANSYRVYTHADLSAALEGAAAYDGTSVIEIMLGKFDIPPQGNIPSTTSAKSSTSAAAASAAATTAAATTAAATTAAATTAAATTAAATTAHATTAAAHATTAHATTKAATTTHHGATSTGHHW